MQEEAGSLGWDLYATLIRSFLQSSLNKISNHPTCALSTSLHENILLINCFISWMIKSFPISKPDTGERWRYIPLGWWWEASNKVLRPCGEGYELLWFSYISKLLAELLKIAAIATPALQSGTDRVAAAATPISGRVPSWRKAEVMWAACGIIVSGLTGKTTAGWRIASLDSQHQCVSSAEDESHSWIIDWIWMQHWRSFNWKHLHVL